MKAVCWHGKHDMRVDTVPDPQILNPHDAIIKITSTAICGSDLHFYDGYIPTMQAGDIIGHEFMGEVVEVGPETKRIKVGDRVVVPFTIACGGCWFCQHQFWSCCDNSNPNGTLAEEFYGATPSALFGYSHLFGGYAGGQAEYARVPFADVGPMKVPEGIPDERVLFLTDILPTAWQAAEYCNIQPGDTVAIWGAGPVGQFAIQSAFLLGAARVIVIDEVPERLQMAREWSKATDTIDFSKTDVLEALKEMTGGRGPDSCLDAVGMEAHGMTVGNVIDRVKAAAFLGTDRPNVLRQCIMACRKAGTVSVPGVYGGLLDKMPFGAAFAKGLTFRMGQTHVHKYLRPLLERIERGDFTPERLISHRMPLDQAPQGYEIFGNKQENCTKIVMHPHG